MTPAPVPATLSSLSALQTSHSLVEGASKGKLRVVHLAVRHTHAGRDAELCVGPLREGHVVNPVAALVLHSCPEGE